MEITEKWIAKAAGWRANKAGRDLFKQDAVLDSTRKNGIITGTLRSGGNPTRVTVKIHSDTDIDTVCPRPQCRRTGEICAHAVALMLHSITESPATKEREPESISSNSKHLCEPLRIDLPPTFPVSINGGKGGISVKLSLASDVSISENDQKLTDWLANTTGKTTPPFIGLRGTQATEFLARIAGHQRVFLDDKKIAIHTEGSRIPMILERDDDRIGISLASTSSVSWYASGLFHIWDAQQDCLMIHNVSKLWRERYWQRLAEGNAVFIPLREFLHSLDAQNDLIVWSDDLLLSGIPITVANPSFTLLLDGSTQLLTAQLQAHYSQSDMHVVGLTNDCDIRFPIADSEHENHFLKRNRAAEDVAAGTLMQAGFQLIDPRGSWQMNSEDAIVEFLTSQLPLLENEWSIKTTNKISSLKNNIVRITPSFELKGEPRQSSGQDWLAFDVNFRTDGGKDIPKEVIQRMLASGKRNATSKNGKRVIISNFDADTIETVLRDTNPKQENGLYYAPKMQTSYLKRLQQHYSNEPQKKPDLRVLDKLPQEICDTLRPYQEEGIAWLYDRAKNDGAALLADDMGLGKTLQTLSLIHLLSSSESSVPPSLVVCPTSLLGNWQEECRKFFPELNTLILHGPKRKKYFSIAHSADIIITSYALIARDLEFYANEPISTLVIDEASLIRNPDTQAAKALRKITAQYRIALTGTPVENAIRDLWSLFHFLLPGYLGSRKDFQQHYQQPLSNSSGDTAVMKRLQMRVEPFMLRRTKAKVANDLPPKILQTVYCEPTASQQKTYSQLLQQGSQQVDALTDKNAGAARIKILTVLLRLRQAANDLRLLESDLDISPEESSCKLIRLLELLSEAKEGNHRVLIFSQFTSMLGLIKNALAESNISYAYLDGATKDRTKEVEKFQSPTGPDVFLISLKAGGYGLNLTAADTVIHFDPWWNPAVEAQATDRAYRIGQTKPTTVYKMVTRGTVEEKIIRLQQAKQGLISATLGEDGDDAPLMQGLSQQEITGLLSP